MAVNPIVKDWLEVANYVGGVAIAIFAAFGLRQIIIAKHLLEATRAQVSVAREDVAIRSRREAIVLAAERCHHFGKEIVPTVLPRAAAAAAAAGVQIIEWELNNSAFDQSSVKQAIEAKAWLTKILSSRAAQMEIVGLLNDLEAFAMYFARGAADEEIAYPVVGALFCQWIRSVSPYLVALREKAAPEITSGPYQNVVELYECWSGRARQTELQAEVARITAELAANKPSSIAPIGVDSSQHSMS